MGGAPPARFPEDPREGPWPLPRRATLVGARATRSDTELVLVTPLGDRTFKLGSSTTSEPGRYVKSLGEPVTGSERPGCGIEALSRYYPEA